jgi:hypothetical protein
MEPTMNSPTLFTCDDDVVAIGRGLFDRTLPKRAWTHAAHFAAAVWVLTCRPDLEAAVALPPAIRAYNESTGVANTDTGGYHETITLASIRAARAFVAAHASSQAFETCNALLASPLGRSDWLFAYWSRGRLFSADARKAWIDPDLQAFPF